jgi:superfamily I DNA/RNA helicase
MMQRYCQYRTRQIPRDEWRSDVRAFADAWEDWKGQCNYIDFLDLIDQGLANLDHAPGKPAVIMLDEGQDTGANEMALLQKWARHAEHFVIGADYFQALYTFRGSDPEVLTRMIESGVKPHVLSQSYRIPRAVHAQAMRWMRRTGLPPVEYQPRDFEGRVRYGNSSYKHLQEDLPMIEAYIKDGKTVMIMATCNYMLDPVLRVLQEAGIAYHNPWRPNNGRWNPLAPRRGNTFKNRVMAFLRPSQRLWGEQARFWTVAEIKAWAKALPVKVAFQPAMKPVVERLSEKISDAEIARALRDWFQPDALQHILALDADWYCGVAEGGEISRPFVRQILRKRGIEALKDTPQTIVGTVHSLKGSEADCVLVYPDISPQAYYGDSATHAELTRTFYVAVTRAREELILMSEASPSCVGW